MLMKANSSFPFVFVVAHNRLIPQQYMESSGISRILAFVHVLIPHRLLACWFRMT